MGYNTIAEIPGSDPTLKDEVVMLGGHMDSWHAGTGATDNGAGVAVAMEAMRIIQTLGLKPKRTIRIGLWTGEEQGLLGSAAYVAQHFGKLEPGNPGVVPPGTPNSQPAAPPKLATARLRKVRRVLQSRQRHRQDSRRLSARQRGRAAVVSAMADVFP